MPRRKEPSGWWDRPDRPKPQSRRNVGPGKQYSSFEEFEKDLSKWYDEVDAKAKEHRDNLLADCAHQFLETQYKELGCGVKQLGEKETVDACILIEKGEPLNRATYVRHVPFTRKYYSSGY